MMWKGTVIWLVQEAGSIVCVQEKLKQLQADVDCILTACYDEVSKDNEGDEGSTAVHGKPNCESLKVDYIVGF